MGLKQLLMLEFAQSRTILRYPAYQYIAIALNLL